MEYKVVSAQRRDEWTSKYGPMVTYAVQLEGVDGWVKLNQKPETAPPAAGQTLFGAVVDKLEGGRPVKKFTKKPRDGDFGGQSNDEVIRKLDEILDILKGGKTVETPEEPPIEAYDDDEIDLSEIPF